MDIIDIKRLIYIVLLVLIAYLFTQLFLTINQRPKLEKLTYNFIELPVLSAISTNQSEASNTEPFDYQIIGTRIGLIGNNSSLILKRNNTEHVVQIGEYLEGRYLLESITKDQAIFLYSGDKIVLNTEINQ